MCPCGTSPNFGFEGDARPTACSKCKKSGMVNVVVTRKCPCGIIPSFGFESDARPTACSKCNTGRRRKFLVALLTAYTAACAFSSGAIT